MQQMEQPFGKKLTAGDAWSWSISLPDFDSSLYTLKFAFRGAGAKLDLVATAGTAGTDYTVNATPAQTAVWKQAGQLAWSAAVYDASNNKTTLATGEVDIAVDVSALDANYDGRSQNKRILDNIRACLEGRASSPVLEYQIGSRHLRDFSRDELLRMEGEYAARVNRELGESGQNPPRKNQVVLSFI